MANERNNSLGKSPYNNAHIIKYDDGEYSLENVIPIPVLSDNDKIHTIMDGETLQSIAYRYYGDSGFWYQIAEANSIINPMDSNEVYIGRRLRIPLYGTSY